MRKEAGEAAAVKREGTWGERKTINIKPKKITTSAGDRVIRLKVRTWRGQWTQHEARVIATKGDSCWGCIHRNVAPNIGEKVSTPCKMGDLAILGELGWGWGLGQVRKAPLRKWCLTDLKCERNEPREESWQQRLHNSVRPKDQNSRPEIRKRRRRPGHRKTEGKEKCENWELREGFRQPEH